MNLHETICRLRTAKGMSQLELAEALDVSRQSISKWETGAAVPELDKLIKLAQIFDITLDELVRGTEPVPKQTPPQPAPAPRRLEAHRVVALALLCTFLLLAVLLLCFAGPRTALALGVLPLAVCAMFLALPRRHLLWGFWVLWLLVVSGVGVLTGGYFLSWAIAGPLRIVVGIPSVISFVFLIRATVRRFKAK